MDTRISRKYFWFIQGFGGKSLRLNYTTSNEVGVAVIYVFLQLFDVKRHHFTKNDVV